MTRPHIPSESRSVAHLPCYDVNPYQARLMETLRGRGWRTVDGGGGGNFFRSALRGWGVRVIHLHWLHPYILRASRAATAARGLRLLTELSFLRAAGKTLVWTAHNLVSHDGRFAALECRFTAGVARRVDWVICHSSYAAGQITRRCRVPEARIKVVPHPSWGSSGTTVGGGDAVMPVELGRTGGRSARDVVTFLFFGRIAPYKGLEDLLAAFGTINREDVRLVIAGGAVGSGYGELIRRTAASDPRVTVIPRYIAEDEVRGLFTMADVAVLPFQDVLTSGSLILAMEHGLPCVAAGAGSVPETLPPAQRELIFPPGDRSGLADRLRVAGSSTEKRAVWGEANRRRVAGWTWGRLADTCETCYAGRQVAS